MLVYECLPDICPIFSGIVRDIADQFPGDDLRFPIPGSTFAHAQCAFRHPKGQGHSDFIFCKQVLGSPVLFIGM